MTDETRSVYTNEETSRWIHEDLEEGNLLDGTFDARLEGYNIIYSNAKKPLNLLEIASKYACGLGVIDAFGFCADIKSGEKLQDFVQREVREKLEGLMEYLEDFGGEIIKIEEVDRYGDVLNRYYTWPVKKLTEDVRIAVYNDKGKFIGNKIDKLWNLDDKKFEIYPLRGIKLPYLSNLAKLRDNITGRQILNIHDDMHRRIYRPRFPVGSKISAFDHESNKELVSYELLQDQCGFTWFKKLNRSKK